MKIFTLSIIVSLILISSNIISRPYRVNQIPNGNINKCLNCHVNPSGGLPLNPFDTKIFTGFLNNGNVVWNSELANFDSDGDGFSNGTELQDPDGVWKQGDDNPGNPNLVSIPGDANSVPNATGVLSLSTINDFELISIAPNPIIDNSKITYKLNSIGNISIDIYDINGKIVSHILNTIQNAGYYTMPIQLKNQNSSNIYFMRVNFNGFVHFRKIIKY